MAEVASFPALKLPSLTVAELTTLTAAAFAGETVLCSDGHDGQPCLARSNGSVWINLSTNAPVSTATLAVAALPSAASYPGAIRHCSNGAAGSPCLVRSDGTNWKRIDLGATAAAS